jgi:hypothetical protein
MRRHGRDDWLLIRKSDEFAGGHPVAARPESVKSGKSVEELGSGKSGGRRGKRS